MSEAVPPAAGEAKGSVPFDSFGTFSTPPGSPVATRTVVWRPTSAPVAEAPPAAAIVEALTEAPPAATDEAPPASTAEAPSPADAARASLAQARRTLRLTAITEAPAAEAPTPVAEAPTPVAEAPTPVAEAPTPVAEAPQAPAATTPPAPPAGMIAVSPARPDSLRLSPIVEVGGGAPIVQAPVVQAPSAPSAQAPLPTPILVPNPATTRPSSRVRTLARPTPMTKSGVMARPASTSTGSGTGSIQRPAGAAAPRPSGSGVVGSGTGTTRRLSSSGVWPADDGWPAELERPVLDGPSSVAADETPRLRRPRRVRRWLTSTALLVVAFTAVVTLVEGELERDRGRVARGPAHVPVVAVAAATPRPSPAPAAPAAAPRSGAARATTQPSIPAPGPARQEAPVARSVAAPQSDFVAMPGPRTSLVGGALADLSRLRTLGARLAAVDKLAAGDPTTAAETLAPLLDGELPGVDGYEVEQLRLKIMSAVGRLPGPVADRALLRRLDPQRPRTERLLALSLLTKRPEALGLGRIDLERMAQGDADVVVKRAATRALGALTASAGGAR